MFTKPLTLLTLAALLMCALPVGALAAGTLTTQVVLTFVEEAEEVEEADDAVYFFGFEGGGGMDIDFGEQPPPEAGTEICYPASDGSHTLRVCDTREAAGPWSVSALISLFTSGDESFYGCLYLYSPLVSDGLTPNAQGDPGCVSVMATARKVMECEANLSAGERDLTVSAQDTRLCIPAGETHKVKQLAYKATVTWTLTLEP